MRARIVLLSYNIAQTYTLDDEGNPKLKLYPVIPSVNFRLEFNDATFPEMLDSSYEWANTFYDRGSRNGKTVLYNGRKEEVVFEWESWTNSYTLFVLLKRKRKNFTPGRIIQLVSR